MNEQLELNLDPINCDICEGEIEPDEHGWRHGHNARPYKDGRACDLCNSFFVIPARLKGIILNDAEDQGLNKDHLDERLEVVVID